MIWLWFMFEIWTVATKLSCDVGIGYARFSSDVKIGFPNSTAGVLGNFPWEEVNEYWNGLSEAEQKESYTVWNEFITDKKKYREACDLYLALTK